MPLIPVTDLGKLKSAKELKKVASSAEVELQLSKVAYALNTAANSGETCVTVCEELLPEVIKKLEAEQYSISCKPVGTHIQTILSF